MFKKLHLSLIAMLCAITGFAQTIVSTSPENRNVVLEEFTGIYCVYCPDGHAIAQAIQNANPDRVSLINIHEGSFSAPSGNDPDFRTRWGSAIMGQTGLTGFPSGTVNRHVFSGNNTILDRGQWQSRANQILNMSSYVNIGVEAEVNASTGMLTVHVEAYYTGDSPLSTNHLNVALLQDNTKGPQTGGGMGRNYNHMHRLVELLTDQWGDVIETTTSGSFIDRTYTYQIPSSYNEILAQLGDMKVVAFITETTQEIITGKQAFPVITGQHDGTDAAIREITEIPQICGTIETNTIQPKIAVSNSGTEDISSMDIQYIINGDSHNYQWTGNLEPLKTVEIVFPQTTHTVLPNNTVEIILPNDGNNDNNVISTSYKSMEATGRILFNLNTGDRGSRLRWEIKNAEGQRIIRGGPYSNDTTISEEIELDEGCYTFHIRDLQKQGSAVFQLKDHHNKVIVERNEFWGEEVLTEFGSNGSLSVGSNEFESISIFPNPTNDILNITRAENANIAIYDILGKEILTKENISAVEGIEVSHLQAGTYFLKIARNGETTTKKFIKN